MRVPRRIDLSPRRRKRANRGRSQQTHDQRVGAFHNLASKWNSETCRENVVYTDRFIFLAPFMERFQSFSKGFSSRIVLQPRSSTAGSGLSTIPSESACRKPVAALGYGLSLSFSKAADCSSAAANAFSVSSTVLRC